MQNYSPKRNAISLPARGWAIAYEEIKARFLPFCDLNADEV
jgi:hypothetical protein